MTCIAYKNGVLATDSMLTQDGVFRGFTKKVTRSPKGTIAAACGSAGMCSRFVWWVEDGTIDRFLDGNEGSLAIEKGDNGFSAIIVTDKGKVILLDQTGFPIWPHGALFYADGSAENFLLGAMAAGASAEEAVKRAIEFDIYSGGPVQVEELEAR